MQHSQNPPEEFFRAGSNRHRALGGFAARPIQPLRTRVEAIRVERAGPGICDVAAPDSGGKLETFYGIRGNWPEEPAPGAREMRAVPGSASTGTERTAASRPEAPQR